MKSKLSKSNTIMIILAFLLVLLSLSFLGCVNPSNSDSVPGDSSTESPTDLWGDSSSVSSNMALSNAAISASVSYLPGTITASATTTNKIYFRSSDIEFWSVDSIDGIDDIFSAKYQDAVTAPDGFANGRSLEYDLGDSTESVVFTPYNNYSQSLGGGLNDLWAEDVDAFITAGLTNINLARLDIGNGQVAFIIDGQRRQVLNADKQPFDSGYTLADLDQLVENGDVVRDSEQFNEYRDQILYSSGFDANSFFFVDRAFLSEPVLIEVGSQTDLINGTLTASDLGISTADYTVVKTIISNKNEVDDTTMVDVDGAFFLPLDPVDLTGFDSATNTLQIEVGWDIAKAIHRAGDQYFMDNRVKKTAFDFSVAITIQ